MNARHTFYFSRRTHRCRKTSLAKEIAQAFQFEILKEIVDENPFLGKFYENIDEWSFQTEMFFLCNRYKQLEDIQKGSYLIKTCCSRLSYYEKHDFR